MQIRKLFSLLLAVTLLALLFAGCGPGEEFPTIEVTLSGGSGRATVESPAALVEKDGVNYAVIVWSSSNYSYMVVDGVEYLPTTQDGNSTFVIPVTLDTDMPVIACTEAMGSPKEIEYTLFFDSATIQE